jgi:hypothetical protein
MAIKELERRARIVSAIEAQQEDRPGYLAALARKIVADELEELEREMTTGVWDELKRKWRGK